MKIILDNLGRTSEIIYKNNNSEELIKDKDYQYNSNSCNASDGSMFIVLFRHKTAQDYVQHILIKETRKSSIQVLGFSSNAMQLNLYDRHFCFFEGIIPEYFILDKIYKIKY